VVEGGEGVEAAHGTVAAHQCPARWGVEGAREAGEAAPGGGGRPRPGRKGRPEVEDTPDRWVPLVGEREREERERWSGPRELLARKRNGPAG
jgi:hypothetical protein